MTQLGQCDNVTVKLSGGFSTNPQWTHQSAVEIVKDTVKCFGSNKYTIWCLLVQLLIYCMCVLGLNFPVDKINGTFSEWGDSMCILSLHYIGMTSL